MMLLNPFTPTEIVSNDHDFFGRSREVDTLNRALLQGSVVIQGPMGIGKSSLLARALLVTQEHELLKAARPIIAVGNRDVVTVNDAARLLLAQLLEFDEHQRRIAINLGPLFSAEFSQGRDYFAEGRHLDALKSVVTRRTLGSLLTGQSMLVFAIDEADKCPVAIARLVRSILTQSQQEGFNQIRFILAGVSPFLKAMITEDAGVLRMFHKTITLQPMSYGEAKAFLAAKFRLVSHHAEGLGIDLTITPEIVPRILDLSGGHPHLLQLLGSHVIESEAKDPDGVIDSTNLIGALRRISYEERGWVYDNMLDILELNAKLTPLRELLTEVAPGFPTSISKENALRVLGSEGVQWLLENNILMRRESYYGLVDEFLRIRIVESEIVGDIEDAVPGLGISRTTPNPGVGTDC